jgi:hypothetical protein
MERDDDLLTVFLINPVAGAFLMFEIPSQFMSYSDKFGGLHGDSGADEAGAGGVSAPEDGEADEVTGLEAVYILCVNEGGADGACVAKLFDVMEEFVFGKLKLFGNILHDAHVGLVGDEVG